ncbi:2-nitropropane dioxygenase [Anaplasmataceae bacterium AB001_6]|nr:2-nitropropane dioxygenase [Anaplasmataceae bacterium AB001_6]
MSILNVSQFWKRGADFLGVEHSIMAGAMSWISDHTLVKAIADAGGFGILACSSMSPDMLHKEIIVTNELLNGKPYGVNLIMVHPQLDELIDVCISNGVKYIIFAGGMPSAKHIEKAKKSEVKTMAFAPTLSLSKRLIRIGIDALVIEGSEAGGHIGPVSTLVLAQEILPYVKEVPVFVAGGIGSGSSIVNFLRMGASGCQIGTLFACAKESIAHENFKKVMLKANARDAQVSVQFSPEIPVIPVRSINNLATREFIEVQKESLKLMKEGKLSKQEAILRVEKFWAGALRRAVIEGDIERGSLMSGQSVGLIKEELPVKQIIDNLISEANAYINPEKHECV